MVECWNMMNEYPEGQGNPPDSDPPPGLDWEMFLGPAPKRPYNRNRYLYTFRQFWDYAGSMMADWGAHHMDIVQWAMGVDAPQNVTATGGKFVMKDDRETPDTFMGDFEYPGFTARYTYRYTNGLMLFDRPNGIAFYGTLGTLVVDRSSYAVYPEMRPEIYHTDAGFHWQLHHQLGGGAAPSKRPAAHAASAASGRATPALVRKHGRNWHFH